MERTLPKKWRLSLRLGRWHSIPKRTASFLPLLNCSRRIQMHSLASDAGRWCPDPSRLLWWDRLRAKRISKASNGLHVSRIVGIFFDLFSNAIHVDLEAIAVKGHVIS